MKNLILCFCLLFVLSCKMDFPKTEVTIESDISQVTKSEPRNQIVYGPKLPENPYELKLDTHKLSDGVYDIEMKMFLYNDAFYASPNEKKDLKGKFTFVVANNDFFTLEDNLIETHLSAEKHNYYSSDYGPKWIHENTSYKQKLEISTTEDFEVRGHIQFTIEPRCTLEKIPVFIKYEKGVLKFEIDGC